MLFKKLSCLVIFVFAGIANGGWVIQQKETVKAAKTQNESATKIMMYYDGVKFRKEITTMIETPSAHKSITLFNGRDFYYCSAKSKTCIKDMFDVLLGGLTTNHPGMKLEFSSYSLILSGKKKRVEELVCEEVRIKATIEVKFGGGQGSSTVLDSNSCYATELKNTQLNKILAPKFKKMDGYFKNKKAAQQFRLSNTLGPDLDRRTITVTSVAFPKAKPEKVEGITVLETSSTKRQKLAPSLFELPKGFTVESSGGKLPNEKKPLPPTRKTPVKRTK